MAVYDYKPNLPPGLLNGLVFFAVVVFGSGYIIFSKLHDFGALAATAVPVLIMIGYAALLGRGCFACATTNPATISTTWGSCSR